MWRFGGVGRDVLKSFVSMLILPTLDRVERNSGPQHCSLMDMDDLHRWNLAAGLEPTYWCLSKARSLLPGLDGTWDTISDQYGIQILLPPWPTQPSSLPSVTQNNEAPRTFSSSHSYRAVHLFFPLHRKISLWFRQSMRGCQEILKIFIRISLSKKHIPWLQILI